jgi:hypothetical protein
VRDMLALCDFAGHPEVGWRPRSGVNRGMVGSASLSMLGDGSDGFGVRGVRVGCGGLDGRGWVEQLVAQVLQQPDALAGHGEAAPASGGSV